MNQTVLFDARLVLEQPTGIGRYIASLLPEILIAAPDISFHVLRRPSPWAGYGLDDLSATNLTQHVTTLPHMSIRQHVEIPRWSSRLGADLLHYPHFDAPVLLSSVPVVATVHDTKELPGSDLESDLPPHKRLALRILLRQTLRRASAIISVSRATSEALESLAPGSSKRVRVVYEAADPDFRPVSADAVDELRRARRLERPFVLSVSERRPHKNIEGLIRAYARSASRASHDLVIVGRPWRDYRGPERVVAELDLGDSVRILGDVSHEELVAFYTAADVFVLVSFYEGFGLPLLEAMACGTPVVASGTSATGEIVADAGLTADPREPASIAGAIDRAALDRTLHDALVEKGRRRESGFTWRRAAEETVRIYREVLAA